MEELILKYFPEITDRQKEMFVSLFPVYEEWNQKINVISRKDIGNLYLHHVLHSLAIAKRVKFPANSRILDVGTGGGFPGVPLAIMFPEANFTLCDSILKKIKVVTEVKDALGLQNVNELRMRADEIDGMFDFVVSRAVTDLSSFVPWVWNKIEKGSIQGINRGIIYLKGGDMNEEMATAAEKLRIPMNKFSKTEISDWFDEEWFIEKSVIFIKR
ncbi:MAG: 16S rRNA (guanine(527)-N(7))-methyltransferase [Bacteroidetes bacterium GWE2_39_28]|nr:MAG: 16S rRNA (guanine(527)-N(7))-methyltransferase [Bacteroidetes bacterium GWE2_39_28]OFY12777.1 MAG: 16S rRNA (guanine(527)-N(7))-methyltransferase [Bacteroidetes bacterium GWF2_39_10]OFZ07376.1 MAG: 16S rRNA (guanine(527)-N(7))-methyltransferase [Bacteroidetes bacterium RIFOXYB2_FULL_39_7]OFZ11002.1 MAG: 16S rRNA (guanine(527)-N(7))-methyltransferase [Bacteroidetes bacterium RIFOXYC2_FULL_39_11]HCT93749.1 16S rRNA (guanine(527)-N(7))-methyltransferase RsmG [Rikenellaceae bacterium]